ncbi:MAG: arylsulfatase, partial [Planctomycetales bacterium]|nr:arylsulfatase [Planctomycetales bacterium]
KRMTCKWCCVLVLCLAWTLRETHGARAAQPHVVIIMVDDLGYGDLGCYNPDSRIPTPHIDRIAAAGMRFTDAHAAGPLCHMSRYGLLTGRYPFRIDVSRWPTEPLIQDGETTIASLAAAHGYQTAMVGKWHLGFRERGYDRPLTGGPVDRGFATFFGIRASTDIPPYFYIAQDRAVRPPTELIQANSSPDWSPIQGVFWRAGGIAPGLKLSAVLPRFTQEAVDIIQQHAARKATQPLFLYLAFPAPHTPWLPADEFLGKSGAGLYGDFAAMVDAHVGRVVQTLADAHMLDETLLIVTSDNGPVWYASDAAKFGHDSVAGLRGMKGDAWEGGHRMPFLVRWPGHVTPGSVTESLIGFTDVLATLADVLGVQLSAGTGPDSISFLPVLRGKTVGADLRTSWAMQTANKTNVVRVGNWKLIDRLGSGGFSKPSRVEPSTGDPAGQLYDLASDPDESENVYAMYPEVVAQLRGQLQQIQNGADLE